MPTQWRKGIIVKLLKEGDLFECANYRGITLLPLISMIILERIWMKGEEKSNQVFGRENFKYIK